MPNHIERPCPLCNRSGIVNPQQLCPRCGGNGYVQLLRLTLPILEPSDVLPIDGEWWERLVVLSSAEKDGKTIVNGITDRGKRLSLHLKPGIDLSGKPVVFVEAESQ